VTRRTFLVIGAVVAAGAGALVGIRQVGWSRIERNWGRFERLEGFGRSPIARLRAHFAWLEVEPGAHQRYLADYQDAFGLVGRFSILRPTFYTAFLLSTDFFERGGDRRPTGRAVRYVSFYDPVIAPCGNPLAGTPPTDEEVARGFGATT